MSGVRFLQYTTTQLFDIFISTPVFLILMITKDQIKEIEDDLKALTTKARALSPDRHGHEQQTAIRSFQKSCLGLAGFELGELKNAFEMND